MSIFNQIEQYSFVPVIAINAAAFDFATEILSAK